MIKTVHLHEALYAHNFNFDSQMFFRVVLQTIALDVYPLHVILNSMGDSISDITLCTQNMLLCIVNIQPYIMCLNKTELFLVSWTCGG